LVASFFSPAFHLWGSPVTWAEILAFGLALWMVICQWRVHPLTWPLAIASSLIYAALFWNVKLYGEAGLQFVFIAAAMWGWWQWLRGTAADGSSLRVHSLSRPALLASAAAALVAWPALAFSLQQATDSAVPWLDAAATVGSITAQLWLARKAVQNWPLWVAVNLFSVGLFAYKALWLTALLYLLFAFMAWHGWRLWARLDAASPRV
jgi:nicotinamide mononucleotide transporter